MLKLFSILFVAGATMLAGLNSARAATGGCAPAAPATARAPAARAPAASVPATAVRPGTQTIRRYSAAPGAYRAPMSYRLNRSSSGPSYSATRKILGY